MDTEAGRTETESKRSEVAFMFETLIEDMIIASGGTPASVENAKAARDRFLASADSDLLDGMMTNLAEQNGERDEEILAIWRLAETCLRAHERIQEGTEIAAAQTA